MTPNIQDLALFKVDLSLLFVAFLIFLMDLVMPAGRKRVLGALTAVLLATLFFASFWMEESGTAFFGAYEGGPWAMFFKRVALAAGALASLGAIDHVDRHFPERQGEFYLLLLFSMLGMTLLPGARDLVLFIVCFELMGIPLSMLATYAKADDKTGVHRFASEAGLKLYLVSATSTAITLFGLSFVYGMSGSTKLAVIATAPASPLLLVGMLLMLAGMAFKVGVVPFHMWIPDTYQGAPTPFVSFLSVGPKATGMAALVAVLLVAFPSQRSHWIAIVLLMVAVSILMGNLMALPQKDVKRLLGYSGIAQIGYMMMALVAGGAYGTGMLLFYLAGYLVTNMGAFFVLEALAPSRAGIEIDDLDGLARRSPWLALALLMFLLSLAGIPFAVGFWAKLYIFMAAYRADQAWLVLFGALMAIVALFYYLQVARAAYMKAPRSEEPVRVSFGLAGAIIVCLVMVVAMGLYPRPFVDGALAASKALFG